jgi:transcription termination factor Rho
MSVDSTALERSALERKDRDELLTIAKALGGKPPARAKKADIVDLVLELTGVAAADPSADGPSRGDDAPARAPRAPKAAQAAPQAPGEEPPADWEVEAGAPPAPAQAPAPPAAEDGQPDQGPDRPAGAEPSPGTAPEDDETGNRRRRRRGRNRDRDGGQGAPEEFTGEPVEVDGFLDLRDEGYGFLRIRGYLPSRDDVYVSVKQARQFGLRKGDHIKGASRPALRNEKNPALLRIDLVNGQDPERARERPSFEDLTPLFPDSRLTLENPSDPSNMTARIIDLIAPIGKGQRGLIVSPPKAGKTTIMKQIVRSIETNNPEVHLFVLLVDERPEEVTDMRRWLRNESSSVVASTFDRPTEEHIHVAELTIERAKRLVEDKHDVVIVLDGITRLSRAYNLAAPTSGRVMSGGIDTGALYPPKKFFGAARNVEEGGSLTILATALVETGSRMDEVIFEEFKGTGNMELRLDRRLAERRIYPAIDVDASSTRHEELLFLGTQLQQVWKLRRVLSGMAHDGSGGAGLELLTDRMKTFKTNAEFLAEIGRAGT